MGNHGSEGTKKAGTYDLDMIPRFAGNHHFEMVHGPNRPQNPMIFPSLETNRHP